MVTNRIYVPVPGHASQDGDSFPKESELLEEASLNVALRRWAAGECGSVPNFKIRVRHDACWLGI